VERSVAQPDARRWLDDNAQRIQQRFHCALAPPYQVEHVVRALRSALSKTVGLPLCSSEKRQQVFAGGSLPRTITAWTLATMRRESLLELASAFWCSRPAVPPECVSHRLPSLR